MTTMVAISDRSKVLADRLIATGQFDSIEQVAETALHYLAHGHDCVDELDDEIDPDAEADALTDVSDEDREAIREGLRDIKEGRCKPADEVFNRLIAKYTAMAEDQRIAAAR